MAKSKLNTEDEEFKENETPIEEHSEDAEKPVPKDRVADEVQVSANSRKVQIHVVESVDCIIQTVPYRLEKDKSYKVPSDVAAILVYAKKAYRV